MNKSWDVKWFEDNASHGWGREVVLNDAQARCVQTLTSLGAIYNLDVAGGFWCGGFELIPEGLDILMRATISTFDDSRLTSLVVAAHRNYVRVEIGPWYPHTDEERMDRIIAHVLEEAKEWDSRLTASDVEFHCYQLRLHARRSSGRMVERHPGPEHLESLSSIVTPVVYELNPNVAS